jgi:hypothetical protein
MLPNNFAATIRESDFVIRRRQTTNWLNKKCKVVASSNSNGIAKMDISLVAVQLCAICLDDHKVGEAVVNIAF